MTLLSDTHANPTTDTIPAIPASERASRLSSAAQAWGEKIEVDRSAARLTYRVTGGGEGAVGSVITAGKHTIVVDEPSALAGDDVAPSPVEYALAALISCQVVVYRLYAQALGIQLDDVSVQAEGDLDAARLFGLDDSVRPGFSHIRLAVTLTGSDTAERYEELQSVVESRCPVQDLFANPTPITASLTLG